MSLPDHGPGYAAAHAFLASGTPASEAVRLSVTDAWNGPPVHVTLVGGDDPGRGLLFEIDSRLHALHVPSDPTLPAVVRTLPCADVWDGCPVSRLTQVIDEGRTPTDSGRHSALHDHHPPIDRWTIPLADDASMAEAVRVAEASDGETFDHDPLVTNGMLAVLADMAIAHIAEGMTVDAADLYRVARGGRRPLGTDDLVLAAACTRLANPRWVASAIRDHELLRGLLFRPFSDVHVLAPEIDAIDAGAAPVKAARDRLEKHLTSIDAHEDWPMAVWRSLSQADAGWVFEIRNIHWIVRDLFLAYPKRRALDATSLDVVRDVERLLRNSETWQGIHAELGMVDVIRCFGSGDGLGEVPDGFGDALASLGVSLDAIGTCLGVELPGNIPHRVAFPRHRRHAALARISARWHGANQGMQEDLARLRDEVRTRVMGSDDSVDAAYPHFVEEPFAIDGVTVTPLRSERAFLAEGRDMRHCIARHRHSALLSRVFVLSLAGPGDERSTAAFQTHVEGIRLQEHRGPHNAPPHPAHRSVVETLRHRAPMDQATAGRLTAERKVREVLFNDLGGEHDPTMNEDERARHVALHFANVALWLTSSESSLGPERWVAKVGRARRPALAGGEPVPALPGADGPGALRRVLGRIRRLRTLWFRRAA